MEWNSRSRVVAAINHREADRVPIDVNIDLEAYLALKEHLGLEIDETPRPDNMMEVTAHPRVLRALGADIHPIKLGRPRGWRAPARDGGVVDEWGIVRRLTQVDGGASYMETVFSPLAGAGRADLAGYPWPDPAAPGRDDGLAEAARNLYEGTDFAIMGRFGGPILETASHLLGWEEFLLRVADDPEFMGELLDRICEIHMALDEIGLAAAGRYLQIFKVSGEDLGMQRGPLVSRRTFERLFKPRLARRWGAARRVLDRVNPECKIMLHTCGSVRRFIPDFIECGIDILDPVQPLAAEMGSAELKAEFGDRLVFHGGVDVQQVLPFGSPEDVVAEVRQRLKDYAPGGGYILAGSHNLQADVPPANIVAMCAATREYGRYH